MKNKQYTQNGYLIIEYENGSIEKILLSDNIKEDEQIDIPQPTQQEIINAQILSKLDYLECLNELNAMKGGNL